MKLYSLDNILIKETNVVPYEFTGIIEYEFGSKGWFIKGKRHKLDGPAYEGCSGTKVWYIDNKRHRIDGPAYECSDGINEWWVDGNQVTEEQCKLLHDIMKLKGIV